MRKTMKNILFSVLLLGSALFSHAATVYTRVNTQPSEGWSGTYIIVYEKSETVAYVWNGEDSNNNYTQVAIQNGKITSEDLADYQVTVSQEGSNKYYVKTKNGYMGTNAKQNGLTLTGGGKECTIASNGGYVMLETNTNTCRFLC